MTEPQRFDYPSHDAWLQAWYEWRAAMRDSQLSDDERDAKFEVMMDRLAEHLPDAMRRDGIDLPEGVTFDWRSLTSG